MLQNKLQVFVVRFTEAYNSIPRVYIHELASFQVFWEANHLYPSPKSQFFPKWEVL